MTPEHEKAPSPLNQSIDLLSITGQIAEIDPKLSHLLVSLAQTALAGQLEIQSLNPSDSEDTLTKLAQAMENISTLTSKAAHEALKQVKFGQKMEQLAKTDPLTELPNRIQVEEKLSSVIDLYKRHKTIFSFLSIDINDFKQINDTHGHHVGDQALIHFSKILSNQTRPSDLVGRIGGDEFIIIASETEFEGANELKNRILENLKENPLISEEGTIQLKASIGIVSSQRYKNNQNELDPQLIMKDADRAMYKSKEDNKTNN